MLLGEESHSYTGVRRIRGLMWESGALRHCLADHVRCFSGTSGCILWTAPGTSWMRYRNSCVSRVTLFLGLQSSSVTTEWQRWALKRTKYESTKATQDWKTW